jgi:hypothetical protein
MTCFSSTVTVLVAFACAAPVAAQTPPASPSPAGCDTPQSHQFDFWLGKWEVHPNGAHKIIAHSLIEKRYTGCAIRENWMPVGKEIDGGGGSLSLYDPRQGKWRQAWIDSTGTRVDLDGSFANGVMAITGLWENFNGPGKDALVRMSYQLQPDGQVRQWGEASTDDGRTWQPTFDFLYRRVSDFPKF